MKNKDYSDNNQEIKIPDMLGYTLGDAKVLAANAGISIQSVRITAPPKISDLEYDDSFRIIRTKIINDSELELLVCKPL